MVMWVSGTYKPSIEFSMHLGIYMERPEVNCIVHNNTLNLPRLSAPWTGVEKVPVIDIEGVVYLGGGDTGGPACTSPGSVSWQRM